MFRFHKYLSYSVKQNCKLFCNQSNLNRLLLNMPREQQQLELKKIRLKLKAKGSKYVPGTITLQILGSGAPGAPRAVYIFTDSSRYLFNCGEGSQRLAHEHKMKLSKLEQIFITYPSWENIGGLPGVALTIQDVGVPEITLHGPPCTDEIFSATRRFVVLRNLSIRMANCSPHDEFEDNAISVKYVPLLQNAESVASRTSSETILQNTSNSGEDTDDDVDYYAHERSSNGTGKQLKNSQRSQSEVRSPHSHKKEHSPMSMSYICKLKNRPGTLSLEACVDRGVPPGPLLGKLKNGEDVVLADGSVVKSKDVTTPDDPGPVFVVVECPSEEYLDSLLKEPAFHRHQANAACDEDLAYLVVHFTPPHVLKLDKYREWMELFGASTQHLLVNEDSRCMGSTAVHRLQHKLNLLHPDIFPLLNDHGIPTTDQATPPLTTSQHKVPVMQSRTFCNIHLRPLKGYDPTGQLSLTPNIYTEETFETDGFAEELNKYKAEVEQVKLADTGVYPRILFLGTGSCIPNKSRNTSGILVHTSADECVLLDCGEGTWGQLVRFYGAEQADTVLRQLRAIYVSHLHADHHIGLVGVLSARRKAFQRASIADPHPVYLLAPKQIMPWLNLCHQTFEKILPEFQIVPNGDLRTGNGKPSKSEIDRMERYLKMKEVRTVAVRHCPNAFGVAFVHEDGWKLTYSGDTMPCKELIHIGQDSDVLIHEATMEDELDDEARLKMHSTTSQAIDVGRQMRANFILLTHFSQRYAKLPRLNNDLASNVGIAFDNMSVSLRELPLLPKMYPALKLMFAEHCEELEYKALRRQMRHERKRAASLSPPRDVKIAH